MAGGFTLLQRVGRSLAVHLGLYELRAVLLTGERDEGLLGVLRGAKKSAVRVRPRIRQAASAIARAPAGT